MTATYRSGNEGDTLSISGLATHVFFDTYVTEGMRDDLVREAFTAYSPAAFAARHADPSVDVIVAHDDGHLVGFADLQSGVACPAAGCELDAELVHLYVHPRFQRRGIGAQLLARAEAHVAAGGGPGLWLSTWCGNANALAFYAVRSYAVIGAVDHVIEGTRYENKVLARFFAEMPR